MCEDELPQWVIDDLTDIKMAARDLNMTDEEFFALVSIFADRLNKDH